VAVAAAEAVPWGLTFPRAMLFLRLTFESFRFAWQALKSNLLRTTLSLLGVTVGIFSIIAVFTLVDSLERNVKDSLSFIGKDVIYIQKWPWFFGEGEWKWWEYFRRPAPKMDEFRYLEQNLESSAAVAILDADGGVTLRNGSNSIAGEFFGVSYAYNQITDLPIAEGRYFSAQEAESARNVAILGSELAETLFPGSNALGQEFKVKGIRYQVIAVQEKKGKGGFDIGGSPDLKCYVPYGSYAKLFHNRYSTPAILVKGREDDPGLEQLESEITGLLRTRRGLKPAQDDNFALNRPEAGMRAISGLFDVLTVAGWVIGSFSILVGGFGIANIMFVSVKERTNLIGIQKSLGAQNFFILFQFLFEAVLLSLVGGVVGIGLVWLLTLYPQESLEIALSPANILLGLSVSSLIGMLSGIIPALTAARLDPVIAIRSK
jgi:putative ABC transport system permease protein